MTPLDGFLWVLVGLFAVVSLGIPVTFFVMMALSVREYLRSLPARKEPEE